MKRIVVITKSGYTNVEGDRIAFNEEQNMFFGFCGNDLAIAIDSSLVLDIHITEKKVVVADGL